MPDTAESSPCPTRLVFDEPANVDAFGAHKKIAVAVVDLITTEDGGRSVGLDGAWGSGKSTVISLIRQELAAGSLPVRTLLFDAWAHEGDPLRRTFLESVIDCLIGEKGESAWIDTPKWKKKKLELAGRSKTATTRTSPKFSTLGWWIAGTALLLTPVGSSTYSSLINNSKIQFGIGRVSWAAVTSLALISAPLLVLIAAFLSYAVRSSIDAAFRRNSQTLISLVLVKTRSYLARDGVVRSRIRRFLRFLLPPRTSSSISDALAMWVQKSVTRQTIKTREQPEPTTIEFETEFNAVLSEALGAADTERRFLIVVDNLDRVDSVHAQRVWSSLQAFLQPRTGVPANWKKNLWVLVPYDERAAADRWTNEHSSSPIDANIEDRTPGAKEDVRRPPAILGFLNKTFVVRFEVPPPLIGDWSKYLSGILLPQAFPKHSADEFANVARLVGESNLGGPRRDSARFETFC